MTLRVTAGWHDTLNGSRRPPEARVAGGGRPATLRPLFTPRAIATTGAVRRAPAPVLSGSAGTAWRGPVMIGADRLRLAWSGDGPPGYGGLA